MKKFALFLACLFCLCQTHAWAETELVVTNVQELLTNIGSHRVLRLAAGTYNLEGIIRTKGEAVQRYHNHGLFLVNLQDLKLVGSGAEQTRIVSPYLEEEVLTVHGCTGIKLENLSIGHTATPGGCLGDSVLISKSAGVQLSRDDIYGCGRFALVLDDVNGLLVQDTVLHDCTYGLVNAGQVQNGSFVNTSFAHKGKLSALNLFAEADNVKTTLTFDKCRFSIDTSRKAFSYEGLPVQEFVTKHSLLSRPFEKPNFPVTGLSFTNCSFENVQAVELEQLRTDGAQFEACQ